ncbi:ABC transporter permease [Thiocystis violascens]|uniref:ABC-type antimicrobial peptide transport system, permease component n=1 Tax=Thiocystis violascens (strain ATCC 17096 / DSM 198 / 6111) TaxID=765911 RepID=I3Y787_THIV6|nr:ABC transporter permease [Thiocystis violascens]AFL72855.1 ABC-type antimicrobial peptide transport system, permease component [Thiocystis violascens DSM 198]
MFWNAFLLALREIRRNVLRSVLTILGIVIGVAAVIVMVTLGDGATRQVASQIESLGSNLLMIRMGQHMGPGQGPSAPPFSVADAAAVGRDVPSIRAVSPSASQSLTAIAGNSNWSTSVTGTDNAFFTVRNWTLEAGRLFTESELNGGRAVCVIGATVRKELFGSLDPLGEKIRLKTLSCEVIGLLKSKGQSAMGSDQDDLAVMPLRTFQRRIAGNQDVTLIQVSVHDGESTERAKADLERLMRERRHILPSEQDNFSVRDMKEIATMLTGTTQMLTALLTAVAAVSLLVGGIGIMNIMLVSVTERTREIGIRLAIGALEREVLLQFLVEAVALSSLGGILGIVLAIGASIGLAGLLQVPFVFNGGIVLIAFFFSAAVGVIFGYFPARRAARLDPIEALRRE